MTRQRFWGFVVFLFLLGALCVGGCRYFGSSSKPKTPPAATASEAELKTRLAAAEAKTDALMKILAEKKPDLIEGLKKAGGGTIKVGPSAEIEAEADADVAKMKAEGDVSIRSEKAKEEKLRKEKIEAEQAQEEKARNQRLAKQKLESAKAKERWAKWEVDVWQRKAREMGGVWVENQLAKQIDDLREAKQGLVEAQVEYDKLLNSSY